MSNDIIGADSMNTELRYVTQTQAIELNKKTMQIKNDLEKSNSELSRMNKNMKDVKDLALRHNELVSSIRNKMDDIQSML